MVQTGTIFSTMALKDIMRTLSGAMDCYPVELKAARRVAHIFIWFQELKRLAIKPDFEPDNNVQRYNYEHYKQKKFDKQ